MDLLSNLSRPDGVFATTCTNVSYVFSGISPDGFHTKASKAEHYRTDLNNVAQRWGYVVSYEASWSGSQHRPRWMSTVYLNNIEYGRGIGGSSGSAREKAAKNALVALGVLRV
ncbi:hypothetical protein B0H14DRAFT_3557490 [Mycena olivaceomarginata]|nr:hypothetical protein B0H14DRAFT_3557490 [Mycena olivaceomarginata]